MAFLSSEVTSSKRGGRKEQRREREGEKEKRENRCSWFVLGAETQGQLMTVGETSKTCKIRLVLIPLMLHMYFHTALLRQERTNLLKEEIKCALELSVCPVLTGQVECAGAAGKRSWTRLWVLPPALPWWLELLLTPAGTLQTDF